MANVKLNFNAFLKYEEKITIQKVMRPESINHFYKNINNLPLRKGEMKNRWKYFEANILNMLVICK